MGVVAERRGTCPPGCRGDCDGCSRESRRLEIEADRLARGAGDRLPQVLDDGRIQGNRKNTAAELADLEARRQGKSHRAHAAGIAPEASAQLAVFVEGLRARLMAIRRENEARRRQAADRQAEVARIEAHIQILQIMASGATDQELAERLGCGRSTACERRRAAVLELGAEREELFFPCPCGCGRQLRFLGRGRPPVYATGACRSRVWRRGKRVGGICGLARTPPPPVA
mgnify:FL=1